MVQGGSGFTGVCSSVHKCFHASQVIRIAGEGLLVTEALVVKK